MINFPFLPVEGLHEFNLDWFLNRFHELSEEWDETKAAWIALKEWVENYFENLDVQNEINNKIDEMYENGTLEIILSQLIKADIPVFVNSTEEMTNNKNIYVLASTGHIWAYKDGAFYDTGVNYTMGLESVTGSLVHITTNNVEQYNDFNTLTTNNIYAIDSTALSQMDNRPPNIIFDLHAQLLDFSYHKKNGYAGGRVQYLKSISNGYLYYRGQWGTSWGPWTLLTPYNKIFTNETYPSDLYPSANDFPTNSTIFMSSGVTSEQVSDLPVYDKDCCVITNKSYGDSAVVQLYITNTVTFTRIKWAEWSPWIQNTPGLATLINDDNLADNNDLNNFFPNSVANIFPRWTNENIAHLPIDKKQQVIHTISNYPQKDAQGAIGVQTSVTNDGKTYIRQKWANSYLDWYRVGFTGISHPTILTTTPDANIRTEYKNADTFPANESVTLSVNPSQIANLPIYNTPLIVETFASHPNSTVSQFQIALAVESGLIFYRASWGTAHYRGWICLNELFTETITDGTKKMNSNSYIIGFGDSLMAGGGSTALPLAIADQIGCSCTNYAVSGARFNKEFTENNIITQINSADATLNPTHIIINGGTNDAIRKTEFELYMTSIDECITAIKNKYPNAHIIYLSPYRKGTFSTGSVQQYGSIAMQKFLLTGCDVINCFNLPMNPGLNIPNMVTNYSDQTHPDNIARLNIIRKYVTQFYL